MIMGIDPGTEKAGWCILDPDKKAPECWGAAPWNQIRHMLKSENITDVVVERAIIYSGNKKGSNKIMPDMIENIGRIQQMCDDLGINYHAHTRMEICEKVGQRRPKRGDPITKKEMQKKVKKHLGLKKIIRPQHANDACAAILMQFPELAINDI